MALGKLLTLGFIISLIILIAIRMFGILGDKNPSSLIFISAPLVISLIVFLIQAIDTQEQWYTGAKSILKFVFVSPFFWSIILTLMLVKIGGTMIYIENNVGKEALFNTGDLLNYTMGVNLVTALIYSCLLYFFNASETLVKAINITGLCSFLLILCAIVNIYFYVEITTKPVLP